VGGSLSDPNVLTLARYAPSRYRLSGQVDAYEVQLAGLLRSGLLKRFESSAHAFACTCEKMAASHDAFLALLEEGKVAIGTAFAEWMATDSDELEVANYLERFDAELEHADQFDVDTLTADVTNDRDLLLAFARGSQEGPARGRPQARHRRG